MSKKIMNGVIITAGTTKPEEMLKIIEAFSRPIIGLSLDGIQVVAQFGQTEVEDETQ